MQRGNVPVRFLKNLVDLVADEEQLSTAGVLRGTGITQRSLETVDGLMTFDEQIRIYERIAEVSAIPGIGFRSPSARSFADHGLLGALLVSAETVGEAFKILGEFAGVTGALVTYNAHYEGSEVIVVAKDVVKVAPTTHRLITEENLAIWKYSALPVPGLDQFLHEIRIDYPRPKHWRMYQDLFSNVNVRFGSTYNSAVLSRDIETLQMPSHNPEAFNALKKACEEQLERMRPTMRGVVAQILQESNPTDWHTEFIANELNTTSRTLARRLRHEGTTAKSLIEANQIRVAQQLIERNRTDAYIAGELGFASKSSFARAFKRSVGLTPSQYRKSPE